MLLNDCIWYIWGTISFVPEGSWTFKECTLLIGFSCLKRKARFWDGPCGWASCNIKKDTRLVPWRIHEKKATLGQGYWDNFRWSIGKTGNSFRALLGVGMFVNYLNEIYIGGSAAPNVLKHASYGCNFGTSSQTKIKEGNASWGLIAPIDKKSVKNE